MLQFNILLTILCVWAAWHLNFKVLSRARLNKDRFKLFALRDELTRLAMAGKISTESEEYQTLLTLLNRSVHTLGSFNLSEFVAFIVALHEDPKLVKELEAIKDKLNHTNEDYRKIVSSYFAIMRKTLNRQTFLLRWAIIPILLVVFICFATPLQFVRKRKQIIEEAQVGFAEMEKRACCTAVVN